MQSYNPTQCRSPSPTRNPQDARNGARAGDRKQTGTHQRSFGPASRTYVTRQRVQLAQRLLLTTEDSMCQISVVCGMCDQARLTRVFQ
jgi:transcriptional regulator GlxA family with amidase domain